MFDSKEDCYLALLAQIAARIEKQAMEALADAPDDPDETVHRLHCRRSPTPSSTIPGWPWWPSSECAGISPRVERLRRENRRRTAAFLEDLWRQREFPCPPDTGAVDYHALAVSTVGGLFESVADWLHQREAGSDSPPTTDTLVGNLTSFVAVVRAGIAASTR